MSEWNDARLTHKPHRLVDGSLHSNDQPAHAPACRPQPRLPPALVGALLSGQEPWILGVRLFRARLVAKHRSGDSGDLGVTCRVSGPWRPLLHPPNFIQRLQLAAHHIKFHVNGRNRCAPHVALLQQGMAAVMELLDAGLAVTFVHSVSPFGLGCTLQGHVCLYSQGKQPQRRQPFC